MRSLGLSVHKLLLSHLVYSSTSHEIFCYWVEILGLVWNWLIWLLWRKLGLQISQDFCCHRIILGSVSKKVGEGGGHSLYAVPVCVTFESRLTKGHLCVALPICLSHFLWRWSSKVTHQHSLEFIGYRDIFLHVKLQNRRT